MKAIIAFIIIFSVIVIFHEFGHFIFAKRAGILVREFSIGMGPRVFHYQGEETSYSVRLLPVGGYVRMAGLEETEEVLSKGTRVRLLLNDEGQVELISLDEADDSLANILPVEVLSADLEREMFIEGIPYGETTPVRYTVRKDAMINEGDGNLLRVAPIERQFQSAKLYQRLLTNFAGPMNNFILGILAFILMAFINGGVPSNEAVIGPMTANYPAAASGLEEGDQILQISGQAVTTFSEMQQMIQSHPNEEVTMLVKRNNQELTIHLTPKAETLQNGSEVGVIGVSQHKNTSFIAKVSYGFTQTWQLAVGIFSVLIGMFKHGFSLNQFGGPVYMYQQTSQVVQVGVGALVYFMAYLSINLGIVNLLPFPALDGGKLLLNLIEGVRGKPVSPKVEGMVNLVGAGLLVLLFIAVTWNDILRLF